MAEMTVEKRMVGISVNLLISKDKFKWIEIFPTEAGFYTIAYFPENPDNDESQLPRDRIPKAC